MDVFDPYKFWQDAQTKNLEDFKGKIEESKLSFRNLWNTLVLMHATILAVSAGFINLSNIGLLTVLVLPFVSKMV